MERTKSPSQLGNRSFEKGEGGGGLPRKKKSPTPEATKERERFWRKGEGKDFPFVQTKSRITQKKEGGQKETTLLTVGERECRTANRRKAQREQKKLGKQKEHLTNAPGGRTRKEKGSLASGEKRRKNRENWTQCQVRKGDAFFGLLVGEGRSYAQTRGGRRGLSEWRNMET